MSRADRNEIQQLHLENEENLRLFKMEQKEREIIKKSHCKVLFCDILKIINFLNNNDVRYDINLKNDKTELQIGGYYLNKRPYNADKWNSHFINRSGQTVEIIIELKGKESSVKETKKKLMEYIVNIPYDSFTIFGAPELQEKDLEEANTTYNELLDKYNLSHIG